MLDYLNLPNVKTLRVHDIGEHEILVDVEGGVRPARCPDSNCSSGHLVGNGSKTVVIHDIPRDGKWVRVRLKRRRVKCVICGRTASFHVNAFHLDRQMTLRLVLSIEQACLQETVTDMFEAYLRLLGQIAPRTPVVIDRFHVVRMANDAMERVRRRVQLRLAPEERKRLKRERGACSCRMPPTCCRKRWWSAMPGSARSRVARRSG